jgi:hypothetical protein
MMDLRIGLYNIFLGLTKNELIKMLKGVQIIGHSRSEIFFAKTDDFRRKIQNFHIFASIQNTHFPESESGKHFQASGMRVIDFSHKITPREMILRQETQNCSIFASIHTTISLNQDQGSIFTLRECAQSIFRMILLLYRLFSKKIFDREYLHPPLKH